MLILNPSLCSARRSPSRTSNDDMDITIQTVELAMQTTLAAVDGRQMRKVNETDSTEWGNHKDAAIRALHESTVTAENESLMRTYHPAFINSDVYVLTQKDTGEDVWVITATRGEYTDYLNAGSRPIYIQPEFESPIGRGRQYSMTIPDPVPEGLIVGDPLSKEVETKIRYAFPESVGLEIYRCECAIVFFPTRSAMLRTWEAGTPYSLGGLMVGYRVEMVGEV